jgi:hypothetical protein
LNRTDMRRENPFFELGRHKILVLTLHFWALRRQWTERMGVIIMATQEGDCGGVRG